MAAPVRRLVLAMLGRCDAVVPLEERMKRRAMYLRILHDDGRREVFSAHLDVFEVRAHDLRVEIDMRARQPLVDHAAAHGCSPSRATWKRP